MSLIQTGKVKFFDAQKGWGFIAPTAGGIEHFVHYSGILGTGYRYLEQEDFVEFESVPDPQKGLRAEKVKVLSRSKKPEPKVKHVRD